MINERSDSLIREAGIELQKDGGSVSMLIIGNSIMHPKVKSKYRIARRHYLEKFKNVEAISGPGNRGTTQRDLSQPMDDMHHCFNIVFNDGALAWELDQRAVWKNVHYLLMAGGIAIHVLPVQASEGLFEYIYMEGFVETLLKTNSYKLIASPVVVEQKNITAVYFAYIKEKDSPFFFKKCEDFLLPVNPPIHEVNMAEDAEDIDGGDYNEGGGTNGLEEDDS